MNANVSGIAKVSGTWYGMSVSTFGRHRKHKVKFPKAQKIKTSEGTITLAYDDSYKNKFNSNLNLIQKYLDSRVGRYLKEYVSYRDGNQERSIDLAGTYGQGKVVIDVPYAEYQAYSKRIKKRVGKRGTQPFERMVADKKRVISREVQEYARRLDG